MKNVFFGMFLLLGGYLQGQTNINELLAAGLDDAERFTNDYLAPISEGALYNLANAWYNSGEAKPLGGFEIAIIGNITPFNNKEDKKVFLLNTAEYQNLQFVDGSTSKFVSTALGDLEGIRMFVEGDVAPGLTARQEFSLPTGLASEDLNFIPSGFLQASVGLIKGTEVKVRFLPKIKTDEVDIGLFGIGLQHEFTKHLPANRIFPVAISGLIGYTRLDGTYDLSNSNFIVGQNQRLDATMNSWTFQAVVSTKLPIINFYGGLGYMTGTSKTDVLGTYVVQDGPFRETTYEDPFSVEESANGVMATLGAKLKLGFFRLHADYSLAEFNNLSVGLNFGFR
ncbi:DUF6588 family protein [Arenibacter sp. GZD96]|uniref:DUF6588 family protein n=1 Tax=Aurantibrevibacter litoralis TaxID=3106030 RepID=UPI002AFFA234|nr:DUF6588 family protein [Arenibacter sp. GZD-96]MEA1785124.1 DUF6588 family protein [Arenibacter sp. GZD-96]